MDNEKHFYINSVTHCKHSSVYRLSFDTLYHSFLIYSKPFRRSMYILFSRASHPAASAVSSAAKFSLLASSAMVISPVSPNFSKMIPALNPIFAFP